LRFSSYKANTKEIKGIHQQNMARKSFILIKLIIFIPLFFSFSTLACAKECDSCRFYIDSLERPFNLSGHWLFSREDKPENKDIEINTNNWRLAKVLSCLEYFLI
jgi:hypothetical protein